MNLNTICIFDLETGGLDWATSPVLEVAGKAYDARTLEPIAGKRGEFSSLMRPEKTDKIEQKALDVNHITREEIEKAPEEKVIWPMFCEWVKSFNPKGSNYTAPIAGGKNIRGFDMLFVDRLCRQYKYCDKNGKQNIFSNRTMIDLEDFLFYWFAHKPGEMKDFKMDTCREYFGLSSVNAHRAACDVAQTGELIIRFMKLHRHLSEKVTFKKAVPA